MLRYAITDRRFFPGDERQKQEALLRQAHALAEAGIDFIQLREKDLPAADLLSLALDLRSVLPAGGKPRLLLNGPADAAARAGADGVHLPGGWTAADLSAARATYHAAGLPVPLLSVSAHSVLEVEAARLAGADLILFGPIFEKRVRGEKVLPGLGLAALAEAVRLAGSTSLLALGGLTPAGVDGCLAAGAAGIAAIRLFLSPAPPLPSSPPCDPSAVRK